MFAATSSVGDADEGEPLLPEGIEEDSTEFTPPVSPIPWTTMARSASLSGFSMMTRSRSFVELAGAYKDLPEPPPPQPTSADADSGAAQPSVPAVPPPGLLRRIAWRRDLLAIGVVYFVEGILDMMSLAVSYYLKDALQLGPAAAGLVQTLGQLPWQATPLLALITDGVPVFGYHRKGYLVLVGGVGALCWAALSCGPSVVPSVVLMLVANACTAWTQVIADAVTVKLSQGQDQQLAAFYQSYSWGTYMLGGVLSAYTSGRLLDSPQLGPRRVFALAAACLLLDAAVACLISEDPKPASKETTVMGLGGAELVSAESPLQRGWRVLVQVWATLRSPHIYVPALFIFLWQSSPAPTSAMFYFQTNVLGFDAQFQEWVYIAGVLAALSGVLLYNALLVQHPIRTLLLCSALAATALNATQLVLVSRLNLRLGLSDKLFVLGDYAMLAAVAEVMMTPMLAMAARVCPEGVEATLYASLYCIINLSTALSTALGAAATRALGVTETNFDNMTWLVLLCNLWMLLPLPLLLWVPSGLDPLPAPPAELITALALPRACSEAAAEEGRAGGGSLNGGSGATAPPSPGDACRTLSLHLERAASPTAPWGAATATASTAASAFLLEERAGSTPPLPVAGGAALPAVIEHGEGLPHWAGTSPSATVLLGRLGLPSLALPNSPGDRGLQGSSFGAWLPPTSQDLSGEGGELSAAQVGGWRPGGPLGNDPWVGSGAGAGAPHTPGRAPADGWTHAVEDDGVAADAGTGPGGQQEQSGGGVVGLVSLLSAALAGPSLRPSD